VKEDERVLRSERYFGRVAPSILLAQEVDETKASAKLNDDVLELRLSKRRRLRPASWPSSEAAPLRLRRRHARRRGGSGRKWRFDRRQGEQRPVYPALVAFFSSSLRLYSLSFNRKEGLS